MINYPWDSKFLFEAADPADLPPDEDTGTNEPVEQPADEVTDVADQPDPALAADIATDTSDLDAQIDKIQKELEELQKKFDLENEVELLKRRLDNIQINDDADLNDSLNQTAYMHIKFIKRAIRRLNSKYLKESSLTGAQQEKIIFELEANPQLTCQEIASKLSPDIKAKEQDIFDFIRNTDYRFRHRHKRLRTC